LQRLWEEERDNGLVAVAVNMEEPDQLAIKMAEDLKISLPIGRSNPAMKQYVRARTLPTVVLVDKEGKIRKRWSGYKEGLDIVIQREVRALLADDPGGETEIVGSNLQGGARIGVDWSRKLPSAGVNATVIQIPSGEPALIVSTGRELHSFRSDGKLLARTQVEVSMDDIVAEDLTGDGVKEIVGFRRGSNRIGIVDFATRASTTWEAPEGILSLALTPPSNGQAGSILVGTLQHLYQMDANGAVLSANDGGALGVSISGRTGAMALLDPDKHLYRFDAEGRSTAKSDTLAGAWLLFANDESGVGIGSNKVQALTSGIFDAHGKNEIVLATVDGEILFLDAANGQVQSRLSWPGLRDLYAWDLDSDGLEELIVVSGNRVTVLSCDHSGGEASLHAE
jgi:hypothetical protein